MKWLLFAVNSLALSNPGTGDDSLKTLLLFGGIGAVALILMIILAISVFRKKK